MADTQPGGNPARSIGRALELLGFLASDPAAPQSPTDLALGTGMARSTTRNVCHALEAGGMVRRHAEGYQLGWRLVELASAHLSSFDELRHFYRAAAESSALAKHLLHVAILDDEDVLYVARHEGRAPLRLSARIGDRLPAATTAVGQALLAQLSDADIHRRMDRPGTVRSERGRGRSDAEALAETIRGVRMRGYAVEVGGVHRAVTGVAAAVPHGPGLPRFAVGVSLIAQRPTADDLARYGRAVKMVAAQMSNAAKRA